MAEGENEFEYFMYGPVLVPIAALGIIGNFLSIIVYSRPSMRKSAINIILIGLFLCILLQARKGFRPITKCDVGNWIFSKSWEFLGNFFRKKCF